MLSKNRIKFLKSLQVKKYRKLHQNFIVEGEKSVLELLKSDYEVLALYASNDFIEANKNTLTQSNISDIEEASIKELSQASAWVSNQSALALVKIPKSKKLLPEKDEYILALDNIQDAGNLGTILRIADWYGITKIICSKDTVDLYNPKAISASMASFLRVHLYYCNLKTYFEEVNTNIYGALLNGKNIHNINFNQNGGIILLGNESQGIQQELMPFINQKITIPKFGQAESLNVAIATAVICDNLRKNIN